MYGYLKYYNHVTLMLPHLCVDGYITTATASRHCCALCHDVQRAPWPASSTSSSSSSQNWENSVLVWLEKVGWCEAERGVERGWCEAGAV